MSNCGQKINPARRAGFSCYGVPEHAYLELLVPAFGWMVMRQPSALVTSLCFAGFAPWIFLCAIATAMLVRFVPGPMFHVIMVQVLQTRWKQSCVDLERSRPTLR